MPIPALKNFLKFESLGGLLLIAAAIIALVVSNSALAPVYVDLLATRVAVICGALSIDKPLLLWVNDGLMAIFFLLIGLELKREILEGQLSSRDQLVLPTVGAIGGFALPVTFYAFF
ncbi:MAG: Na+/H+ antiporter NhaA, partial [Gammaproteobacteria bacterium]|nr:Na+/H+ antiporter NhaA [Gammaproteobacteria bacterium]